jgi:predicted histone-like DNA-binding protein
MNNRIARSKYTVKGNLIMSNTNKLQINKRNFINMLADKTGLTKAQAAAAFSAMIDIIKTSLADGKRIVLPGFGTFKMQAVQARKARNIKKQTTMEIPARNRIKFTPGKTLKAIAESADLAQDK